MEPHASVIIVTRNGMPLFRRCLEGVLDQKTEWPFEVVVVDSGSTDGTWELALTHADRAVQISPSDFNHGATRNYGARLAAGQFLVFLVQDAIPADEHWLSALVEACRPDGVAGSYSRQIPRAESDPITQYLCQGTTPSDLSANSQCLSPGVALTDLPPAEQLRRSLFQDASSCLKREVWERYPFAPLRYGEDIEWGKRVIEAGHTIAYEPASTVRHSHDRAPFYYLKRAYADHYQAAELFDYVMLPSPTSAARAAAHYLVQAWRFGLRQNLPFTAKFRFIIQAPLYAACLGVGQFIGPQMSRQKSSNRWTGRLNDKLRAGV